MEKIKAILHDRDKLREAFLYLLFGVLTTLVSWAYTISGGRRLA